jgi:outer membrane protein OmpA-like peptidoglycan-associated protein
MFKNALLASALSLSVYVLATNAEAGQRPEGWYIDVDAGVNWTDKADVVRPGTDLVAEFDSDLALFGSLGYRWANNWRVEFEGGWRRNDADCAPSPVGPCTAANWGDVSQITGMINVVHDIELDEKTALSIGLGLGGDFVDIDAPGFTEDDDFVLGAQAILQLSHELTQGIDLVLTYRFLTTDEPEFRYAGTPLAMDNENHTLTVGLRFDLEADQRMEPTPVVTAPPPPVTPPAPRQFVVYFGFNKTSLSKAAKETVSEAASAAMRDGFASILVTGHTDTVGSSRYNANLSKRRAETVKAALVKQGIPAKGITATGKGESELMVQTGDREMEPRNRRAEIDLN